MPEKLAEGDVRGVDQSQYSTIPGYTRQPPGCTDSDLPRWQSCAPALLNHRHFFGIILSVGSKRFRPGKKNCGTIKENCHCNETDGFAARRVGHGLPSTYSALP